MIRSVSPTSRPALGSLLPTGEVDSALTLDRLAHVEAGSVAVIDGVEGAPALHRRLLEAGFTAGSAVRFVMATPFGDPLVFSLRGATIALRKAEARCVRVRF